MSESKLKIALISTGLDENAPPINLAYLASNLKSKGFNEVKIIDHTFHHNKNLIREVQGVDLVGISAIMKYYKKACKIAEQIKKSFDLPVIIGGIHISMCPASLVPVFDLGVIGEGERTLVSLCETLSRQGSLSSQTLENIPGLVYWDNGRLSQTQRVQLVDNIDQIPVPAYELLDKQYLKRKWINWTERMGRSMHIISSRGCPYNCLFCAATKFWKTTRFHSPQRVFEEVNMLFQKWGIDHIVVDDDLFLTDKSRLQAFADLLKENNLSGRVAFSCMARSNLIGEDMCRILKEINVKALNFGFESGNNKVLRFLKGNNITVEDHRKAIELCNAYGFKIYGSLMLGNPGETIDDMKETLGFIDFTIKNKCHKIWAFVTTPLPGTPFWEMAKQRGKVNDAMDWELLDFNNCDNAFMLDPDVDPEEFKKVFKKATALLDKAWMKDKWFKTIFLEHRMIIRRFLQDPRRAIAMLRNIFLG